MNLKLSNFWKINSRAHLIVAGLFLSLAFITEVTLIGYWSFIIQPRLYDEAYSNAKILAESRSQLISQIFTIKEYEDSLEDHAMLQHEIDTVFDQMMIFADPEFQQAYFLGIELEIDSSLFDFDLQQLNLSAGKTECGSCFEITSPLFSPLDDELIGVAHFKMNDFFYQKLKKDLKQVLLSVAFIILGIFIIVWFAMNYLIHQLKSEISVREQMSEKLKHAKERAEQANKAKSDFLANVSHEIRTPLNGIIGIAYILSTTPLNKEQNDLLKKLDSASKLLLVLINDLLDFSKIEAGKLELEATNFSIEEVLNTLLELIQPKLAEKQLEILFDIDSQTPDQMIGDPLRLGQVLLNLTSNAIKFTEQGHVLIKIETLKQSAETGSLQLKFSVIDTGIGIKAENIDKLFSAFTQADSSTTRRFGGTGLGLAISKRLVQLMGGEIQVESDYGKGSHFSFSAHFHFQSSAKPVEQVTTDKAQKARKNAYIIDPNPLVRSLMEKYLHPCHCDCTGFESIDAAISAAKKQAKQSIDIVFVDVRQIRDNPAIIDNLLAQFQQKHRPGIVGLRSYADKESSAIKENQESIYDDVITKPFYQQQLIQHLSCLDSGSKEDKEHQLTTTNPVERQDYSHKHVLLTEDNKINQMIALALLKELKVRVSVANNGQEAVELARKNRYDLIFMDLQMPVMDGFEATRQIRQQSIFRQIPIIAMTAHAMTGYKQKCLDAQMDDYISKPLNIEKFFNILDKWL